MQLTPLATIYGAGDTIKMSERDYKPSDESIRKIARAFSQIEISKSNKVECLRCSFHAAFDDGTTGGARAASQRWRNPELTLGETHVWFRYTRQ